MDFEASASEAGLCVTSLRSFDEWDVHPQGQALRDVPAVQIVRVGDAPKRTLDDTAISSPLQGVRVLDLTRIIAGPVCGRTLAGAFSRVLSLPMTGLHS